jgi:hypothetical protein
LGRKGTEPRDHDADPEARNNLAADPGHAEVVSAMKSLRKRIHPAPIQAGKAAPDTRAKYCDWPKLARIGQ